LERVAEAFGIHSATIEQGDDIRAKVRAVLDSPGPTVCVVKVITDEPRMPRLVSFRRPDGSMESRPLEDLFPLLDREEFLQNMIVPAIEVPQ